MGKVPNPANRKGQANHHQATTFVKQAQLRGREAYDDLRRLRACMVFSFVTLTLLLYTGVGVSTGLRRQLSFLPFVSSKGLPAKDFSAQGTLTYVVFFFLLFISVSMLSMSSLLYLKLSLRLWQLQEVSLRMIDQQDRPDGQPTVMRSDLPDHELAWIAFQSTIQSFKGHAMEFATTAPEQLVNLLKKSILLVVKMVAAISQAFGTFFQAMRSQDNLRDLGVPEEELEHKPSKSRKSNKSGTEASSGSEISGMSRGAKLRQVQKGKKSKNVPPKFQKKNIPKLVVKPDEFGTEVGGASGSMAAHSPMEQLDLAVPPSSPLCRDSYRRNSRSGSQGGLNVEMFKSRMDADTSHVVDSDRLIQEKYQELRTPTPSTSTKTMSKVDYPPTSPPAQPAQELDPSVSPITSSIKSLASEFSGTPSTGKTPLTIRTPRSEKPVQKVDKECQSPRTPVVEKIVEKIVEVEKPKKPSAEVAVQCELIPAPPLKLKMKMGDVQQPSDAKANIKTSPSVGSLADTKSPNSGRDLDTIGMEVAARLASAMSKSSTPLKEMSKLKGETSTRMLRACSDVATEVTAHKKAKLKPSNLHVPAVMPAIPQKVHYTRAEMLLLRHSPFVPLFLMESPDHFQLNATCMLVNELAEVSSREVQMDAEGKLLSSAGKRRNSLTEQQMASPGVESLVPLTNSGEGKVRRNSLDNMRESGSGPTSPRMDDPEGFAPFRNTQKSEGEGRVVSTRSAAPPVVSLVPDPLADARPVDPRRKTPERSTQHNEEAITPLPLNLPPRHHEPAIPNSRPAFQPRGERRKEKEKDPEITPVPLPVPVPVPVQEKITPLPVPRGDDKITPVPLVGNVGESKPVEGKWRSKAQSSFPEQTEHRWGGASRKSNENWTTPEPQAESMSIEGIPEGIPIHIAKLTKVMSNCTLSDLAPPRAGPSHFADAKKQFHEMARMHEVEAVRQGNPPSLAHGQGDPSAPWTKKGWPRPKSAFRTGILHDYLDPAGPTTAFLALNRMPLQAFMPPKDKPKPQVKVEDEDLDLGDDEGGTVTGYLSDDTDHVSMYSPRKAFNSLRRTMFDGDTPLSTNEMMPTAVTPLTGEKSKLGEAGSAGDSTEKPAAGKSAEKRSAEKTKESPDPGVPVVRRRSNPDVVKAKVVADDEGFALVESKKSGKREKKKRTKA
mmetsp:Transcript_40979/g.49732  ORF Transcript_40979/g.49732 Transcript_40979/m.49732 type:complete len:1170 (-) Transcript_40979:1085-4594(-)|eukprot:CAMPEP_0197846762 /NCGR_PEP_ID=MMETSP1438-20131217/4337_1 /TAXON_ID=1461541 /ORGANISM="Pterosperma sp., Strain CCMP1384" /LENGTH=1169 /DNA_ID=CAMNT_0043458521 /DNA_START=145 /DNA_END=3654 /DNA_ORIENTATION=+